jgi:hypothetical protein
VRLAIVTESTWAATFDALPDDYKPVAGERSRRITA